MSPPQHVSFPDYSLQGCAAGARNGAALCLWSRRGSPDVPFSHALQCLAPVRYSSAFDKYEPTRGQTEAAEYNVIP